MTDSTDPKKSVQGRKQEAVPSREDPRNVCRQGQRGEGGELYQQQRLKQPEDGLKSHACLSSGTASACVSRSVVSDSATPWTAALQLPLSMGFSRQGNWSGLHSLLQGIFPTQGSNLCLLHCTQILY